MLRFYRQSTNPTEVDLAEVLQSVEVLFHGRIAQAGVSVERRFSGSRPLRGFAGELRQVFANLVSNALDASCPDVPGSARRLALRVREECCPRTHAEGVRVTVADTGCGMNEEAKRKLFEPFYTTKGITGTGLGLWVSHQLIEKHKGRVRVRSSEAPGHHGTVFSVFFPYEGGVVDASQ
jgi:signal transduction histidine kinase